MDTLEHSLCRELDFEVQIPVLYVQERLSLKQISERLGVSRDLARRTLKRSRIPVQTTRRMLDLTGQTPFGWKREKGRLVPHVREQKRIARMVESRRSEGRFMRLRVPSMPKKFRPKTAGAGTPKPSVKSWSATSGSWKFSQCTVITKRSTEGFRHFLMAWELLSHLLCCPQRPATATWCRRRSAKFNEWRSRTHARTGGVLHCLPDERLAPATHREGIGKRQRSS